MTITDFYNRSLHNAVDKNQNVILGIAEEIQEYPDVDLTLNIKNIKKFYYSNHNWVFKIDNIPGIIFKIPGNTEEANSTFKDRFNNIEVGKAIFKPALYSRKFQNQ